MTLGYSDWHVKIAGRQIVRRVTIEGSRAFASWDNSYIARSFPREMNVLSVHGEQDEIVPLEGKGNYFDQYRFIR